VYGAQTETHRGFKGEVPGARASILHVLLELLGTAAERHAQRGRPHRRLRPTDHGIDALLPPNSHAEVFLDGASVPCGRTPSAWVCVMWCVGAWVRASGWVSRGVRQHVLRTRMVGDGGRAAAFQLTRHGNCS